MVTSSGHQSLEPFGLVLSSLYKRPTPVARSPPPDALRATGGFLYAEFKDAAHSQGLSRAELFKLMRAARLAFVRHGRRRPIPRKALVRCLSIRFHKYDDVLTVA